jgi:phosphoribosylglycinamide formyltransferase-1
MQQILDLKYIAIFASGAGTNFEALVAACKNGKIPAKVALLVCDNADALVLQRAKQYNISTFVFNPQKYSSKIEYESEILTKLIEYKVHIICLAGYMRIVGQTLLNAFPHKILNIHPALLPAFKGANAIEDAFNFGVKVFGVSVHLIDSTIDGGTIIAQRAFEYHGNLKNEIETKIHEIEHELYPEAVRNFIIQKKNKDI